MNDANEINELLSDLMQCTEMRQTRLLIDYKARGFDVTLLDKSTNLEHIDSLNERIKKIQIDIIALKQAESEQK